MKFKKIKPTAEQIESNKYIITFATNKIIIAQAVKDFYKEYNFDFGGIKDVIVGLIQYSFALIAMFFVPFYLLFGPIVRIFKAFRTVKRNQEIILTPGNSTDYYEANVKYTTLRDYRKLSK